MTLSKNQSTSFFAFLLVLFGIFIYQPALNGFFLSDDFVHVYYLQKFDTDIYVLLKNFWSNWLDVPTTAFYRPLISVTLYFDHLIWGWNPFGYHLTNVVMHALNSVFIFLIVQNIDREQKESPPIMFPFLGALLFLVWPLHPEAVYWIVGRVDVQVTFFYLLSFYLFIVYANGSRGFSWLFASLFSFIAALASKEPAVTLPAVLVIYGFFFLTTDKTKFSIRVIKILHITAPFWLVLVAYFIFRWNVLGALGGGYVGTEMDYLSFSYWKRWIDLYYLFVPINNAWPFSVVEKSTAIVSFIVGWFLLASVILWASIRHSPKNIFFGFLAFIVTLLPLVTVFHVASDLQSSRFLYLPSAILWITIAMVLASSHNRMTVLVRGISTGALMLLFIISVYQLRDNLQPWAQASKEIQHLAVGVAKIAADRDAGSSNGLILLAGIPDNLFGAQVLRNGYSGFLGSVFHSKPVNGVLPITDDDRTGVMPIFAKNLAASNSDRLFGVYRYRTSVGFERIPIGQRMPEQKSVVSSCDIPFNTSLGRYKLHGMVVDADHWLVTGSDPFVTYPANGCDAAGIEALRFSIALHPSDGAKISGGAMQFFWSGADAIFSEERSMIKQVLMDGYVREYTIPLKSSPKWGINLKLNEIRIDFPEHKGSRIRLSNVSLLPIGNQSNFPEYFGTRLELIDMSRIPGAEFDSVNNTLVLDVHNKDEFLLFPRDSWDAVQSDYISVTMRVIDKNKQVGIAKFYWTTVNAKEFSEGQSQDFVVKPDGEWRTYEIPLKHLPAWWSNGRGQQLRLNPYYGNGTVEIKAVSIGSTLHIPQLNYLNSSAVNSHDNASVFMRLYRNQPDVIQLSFQTVNEHSKSILEVSRQPFPNPHIYSIVNTLEFKIDLPGTSGVVQLTPDHFKSAGMRYLRMVSIDSYGQPTGFASDPIALLVED